MSETVYNISEPIMESGVILNGSRELQCGWKTVEIHGFPGNVSDRFSGGFAKRVYFLKIFCFATVYIRNAIEMTVKK